VREREPESSYTFLVFLILTPQIFHIFKFTPSHHIFPITLSKQNCFGHVIHEFWCLHLLTICRNFFRIFLALYVAFCGYRPRPIRFAETDSFQCPSSRWPRPRLWTMGYKAISWPFGPSPIFTFSSRRQFKIWSSSVVTNWHHLLIWLDFVYIWWAHLDLMQNSSLILVNFGRRHQLLLLNPFTSGTVC